MSETSSGPTNGKFIRNTSNDITELLRMDFADMRHRPALSTVGESLPPEASEQIDPVNMYRYYSPALGKFEADAPVALVSGALAEVLARLREALQETGELERENHMAVAVSTFCGISRYVGISNALDDAFATILTAIEAHRTIPYSRKEIIVLENVFERLRRSPIPNQDQLDAICEALEEGGFDLNAPVAGVDLYEEDGGD